MAWFAIYVVDALLVGELGWTNDDLFSVGEQTADDTSLSVRGLAKIGLVGQPDFEIQKWDKTTKAFVPITAADREARKAQKQKDIETLEARANWNAADQQSAVRFILGLLADSRFNRN